MNPSSRASLKARVHQFEQLKKRLQAQQAPAAELLEHKCVYLEDLLRIYTQEVDRLVSDQARLQSTADIDLTREIDELRDKNAALALQVRALNEEKQTLHEEQAAQLEHATANFRRALKRTADKHAAQMSLLQNENGALKAKVLQLESRLLEQDKLTRVETELSVEDLRRALRDNAEELSFTKNQLDVEQKERARMEDELALIREEQYALTSFIDEIQETVASVSSARQTATNSSARVIEIFLQSSERLLDRYGTASNRSKGATFSSTLRPSHRSATAAGDSTLAPVAVSKVREATVTLKDRLDAITTTTTREPLDPQHQQLALFKSGSPGGGPSPRRDPLARQLMNAIASLEVAVESHAMDVALAAQVALDAYETTVNDVEQRLTDSYRQYQLLATQLAEVERHSAEDKEIWSAERDDALNARDQAILQLRAKDNQSLRRVMKHAETQTLLRTSIEKDVSSS